MGLNRTPRSSSLPPEKPFQVKRGGIPRARGVGRRAASVEGRDLSRAEELERARAAARDAGRHARSPRAEIAARRRRVGRCIMLLAKFVDRANEEENVHRGIKHSDVFFTSWCHKEEIKEMNVLLLHDMEFSSCFPYFVVARYGVSYRIFLFWLFSCGVCVWGGGCLRPCRRLVLLVLGMKLV